LVRIHKGYESNENTPNRRQKSRAKRRFFFAPNQSLAFRDSTLDAAFRRTLQVRRARQHDWQLAALREAVPVTRMLSSTKTICSH
jgi:hypothetical protein